MIREVKTINFSIDLKANLLYALCCGGPSTYLENLLNLWSSFLGGGSGFLLTGIFA